MKKQTGMRRIKKKPKPEQKEDMRERHLNKFKSKNGIKIGKNKKAKVETHSNIRCR